MSLPAGWVSESMCVRAYVRAGVRACVHAHMCIYYGAA